MREVRNGTLSLIGLVMLAGLTFGAPIHWPKSHNKSKQDQSAEKAQAPEQKNQKKPHHWFHHEKKSDKSADSNPASS